MNSLNMENLGAFERFTRITLGLAITLSVLYVPYGPVWIITASMVSAYPLLTGLIAFDPVLAMFSGLKEKIGTQFATRKVATV